MTDTGKCAKCGIEEHIHLLDAKPSDGDWEGGEYDRLECVRCYGEGYELLALEHIKLSIAPELAPFYAAYKRKARP